MKHVKHQSNTYLDAKHQSESYSNSKHQSDTYLDAEHQSESYSNSKHQSDIFSDVKHQSDTCSELRVFVDCSTYFLPARASEWLSENKPLPFSSFMADKLKKNVTNNS